MRPAPERGRVRAALAALMLVHAVLVADTLLTKSVTLDETAHLPAGISYLERGTFRMFPLNGPLPRLLPALAARTSGVSLEPLYATSSGWLLDPPNHWIFGFDLLRSLAGTPEGAARYRDLFVRGRFATAAVSILTVPLLFLFARSFVGPAGALLAAAMWALDPTAIAHGGLVTADTAAAAAGLLAALLMSRLLRLPSPARAAQAGAGLGLALLTKYSALWLLPTFALWAAFHLVRGRREVELSPRRLLSLLAAGALAALVTVNAGYLFEGTGTPLGELRLRSRALTAPAIVRPGGPGDGASGAAPDGGRENRLLRRPGAAARDLGSGSARSNRFASTLLGRLPLPVPSTYVLGLDALKLEDEARYQQYLRGKLQREPFRDYYLYALAVKLPAGTWLLIAMGTLGWLWRARAGGPVAGEVVPLLVLVAVPLLSISFLTETALGVRYVLPVLPFLFVWSAGAAREEGPTPWSVLVLLAAGLLAVETARVHPNELAFFNAAAGGPARGRFHLIDSNLDWGQDLGPLGRWLESHPEWRGARLAYGGPIPPEMEGISPHRLAPRDLRFVPPERRFPWEREDDPWSFGPQPGRFAVSVNLERGMFFRAPAPLDQLAVLLERTPGAILPGTHLISHPREAYGYFRELTPRIEPEIGYSILLYDVSAAEAASLRARLGIAPLPPPPAR